MAHEFKVGDKVKVLRKAKTHELGWGDSWEREMDEAVGNIGTVKYISERLKYNVVVSGPKVPHFGYPSFVLELVTEKSINDFKVGQKVVFIVARKLAVQLAKANGTVNADLVQDYLAKLGYASADLGNAAGALFRGKNWKYVRTQKSARKGNHLRDIKVWEYVGA